MQSKRTAFLSFLLAVASTSLPTASAQVSMTSSPISSKTGMYVVQTAISTPQMVFVMNNLLLVRPNNVLLVDTLPPYPLYPLFSAVIHSRTAGQHVGTVVNTHWHFDHVGLNSVFRETEGTETIVAHWRAGEYLLDQHCIEDMTDSAFACMGPYPQTAQPTAGVHGEKVLQLADETIVLKTVENAHSGADLVVYVNGANVVSTGDIYFGGMYPIIDRNGGGTVNGMLHGLNQILARINDQTIVIPAHGGIGNRQAVVEFAEMLKSCRDQVRSLIARGFTEQQIMSHPSFAALDAQWGHGFISGPQFRKIVYRDLAP